MVAQFWGHGDMWGKKKKEIQCLTAVSFLEKEGRLLQGQRKDTEIDAKLWADVKIQGGDMEGEAA